MVATLRLGSSGNDVKRLQRALARQLMYLPFGPITGLFDTELERAVRVFQQGNGLAVDGIVGPATWAALPAYREASPTLKVGSTGPVVAWLQMALSGSVVPVEFAPFATVVDGIFGPATEAAVKALQAWASQTPNGIVDDNTWFTWMTPGSAQHLTLERACGLLERILP